MDQSKGPRAYIACVLWLHGKSISQIAKTIGWTGGQVRGHVGRLYCDPPRARMTAEMRQALLAQLKASRHDNGTLKDCHFVAGPIAGAPPERLKGRDRVIADTRKAWVADLVIALGIEDKERRLFEVDRTNHEHRSRLMRPEHEHGAGFDATSKGDRRSVREIEMEAQRAAKAELTARRARELGAAAQRGINASALEYLHAHRLLRDPGSEGDQGKGAEEKRRLDAGLQLRRYLEASRLGGLGAMDYGRVSGGSSAGMSLTTYKLQCIQALGRINRLMSSTDFALIEAVVDQDMFVWEREPANSRARSAIFMAIRKLLDAVAVAERMMPRRAFVDLWEEEPVLSGEVSA